MAKPKSKALQEASRDTEGAAHGSLDHHLLPPAETSPHAYLDRKCRQSAQALSGNFKHRQRESGLHHLHLKVRSKTSHRFWPKKIHLTCAACLTVMATHLPLSGSCSSTFVDQSAGALLRSLSQGSQQLTTTQ
ncbi:unnamed protein product [Symbiodinium natans]|uniref:Uncharacterized protein n=1 Tax=Symbiodinium natans TaxID=878477 RepID=A0A812K797_9DINO|nr:unnamed protein product [Symbiodinium natans]